ncbi:ribonuclease H2, subunit C [Elsinoe ampelina]|uniref:Ribonuclease H2, subunit C n=1 Tax=Elsinoe ampelina TaxID=302913 RepID=A0A6A6GMJ1_9PEZI|nr:ribonuclease H2, subunit C [Elsinoe ampelina]
MSNTLVVDSAKAQQKVQPNLLPCKISYNGPVNVSSRYWNSEVETDGSKTAYFRGRKLQGRDVVLPDGYSGAVLHKTDRTIVEASQPTDRDEDMSEQEEAPQQLKVVEQVGSFDAITVWDHEALPESAQNPYLKGVEEWIKLSQAIHGQ